MQKSSWTPTQIVLTLQLSVETMHTRIIQTTLTYQGRNTDIPLISVGPNELIVSEKFVPGQDEELERRICDNHKKHT